MNLIEKNKRKQLLIYRQKKSERGKAIEEMPKYAKR